MWTTPPEGNGQLVHRATISLQLSDRSRDPTPDGRAVLASPPLHLRSPALRLGLSIIPVLANEQVGCAIKVEVRGHHPRGLHAATRRTTSAT